jgi:hypothetical protein
MDHDEVRLTQLPQQLRDEGYKPPAYRTLRESALDGAFEAHQINGLWYYNPARSTEIATALRLKKRGAPQTDRQLVAEATAEAAA